MSPLLKMNLLEQRGTYDGRVHTRRGSLTIQNEPLMIQECIVDLEQKHSPETVLVAWMVVGLACASVHRIRYL